MTDITNDQIVDAMERYGGRLVQAVAAMWRAADLINRQRVQAAFREEWDHYRDVAGLRPLMESRGVPDGL